MRMWMLASMGALVGSAAARPGSDLIGVTYQGSVVSIDSQTGNGTHLFALPFGGLTSMARTPLGRLWCATVPVPPTTTTPRLTQLDLVLGNSAWKNFTYLNTVQAFAFSPAGVPYAVNVIGSVQSDLYWLDLAASDSSIKHLVGRITVNDVNVTVIGMTFATDGTLYAWGIGYGLLRIDPTTAIATDVDGLLGAGNEVQSLAFRDDGTLWGAYDDLYQIDPVTGVATLVGPVGFGGVRGIEWFDTEPTQRYCGGKITAQGCAPTIYWSGTTSLSGPDDFHVRANRMRPATPGILLWSRQPASNPFGGATLCVQSPIVRVIPIASGGGSPCAGLFDYAFSHAYMAQKNLAPGEFVHAQYWGRDPGFQPPNDVSFTDAVRFEILP